MDNPVKPSKLVTPEYLKGKLDRGFTLQDFIKDLNVSEDWLLKFVEKRSATGNVVFATFTQRIKENEKKAQKAAEKKQREEDSKASKIAMSQMENTVSSAKDSAPPTVVKEEKKPEAPLQTPPKKVDPVTAEIEELSSLIKGYEESLLLKQRLVNTLNASIDDIDKKIAQHEETIKTLNKQLEAIKSKKSNQHTLKNQCKKQLNMISSSITELYDKISKTTARIKELQKITITVLNNGEVKIDKKMAIPENYATIYADLLTNSLVENLTIKQIQQLAKVLALHKALTEENAVFEIVFEPDPGDGKDSVKLLFDLFTEKETK